MFDDVPGERAESLDLEPIRRDRPVEFGGRVQRLGFREGLAVAAGLLVILAGAGVVAIRPTGSAGPAKSFEPSALAQGRATPTATPASTPRPSSRPGPTPAVTPGGRCLTRIPDVPWVTLMTGSDRYVGWPASGGWLDAIPGPDPDAHLNGVDATVALGQPVILGVGYGGCALEWRIAFAGTVIQQQDNPSLDPDFASQGLFQLTLPATSLPGGLLRIDLHFPQGWSTSAWQVTFDPVPVPDATVVAGPASAVALPGCGFAVRLLASGARWTDSCTTAPPRDLETLHVAPGTLVGFRVAHASFDDDRSASLACGTASGTPPTLVVDPACDANAAGDDARADFSFFAPSRPDVWIVAVDGCVTRPAVQACGRWFVTIDTEHPEPSPSGTVD